RPHREGAWPRTHRGPDQRTRPALDVPRVGAMDEANELGGAARCHHARRAPLRRCRMESSARSQLSEERIAAAVRQYEIERFYYDEAALLDAHRYAEWLTLFSDDAHYFMPIRRTRMQRELDKEFTQPGEIAFFDDSKVLLAGRI